MVYQDPSHHRDRFFPRHQEVCGIPQLRLRRDLRDVLPGAAQALAQRPGVAAGDLVLLGIHRARGWDFRDFRVP